MSRATELLEQATPRRDVIQELVDEAFPTGGTDGPNAWTDERIRVRTRYAEACERILADYEAAVEAAVLLADAVRRYFDEGQTKAVVNMQPLTERIEGIAARLREGEAAHVR